MPGKSRIHLEWNEANIKKLSVNALAVVTAASTRVIAKNIILLPNLYKNIERTVEYQKPGTIIDDRTR